MGTDRSVGVLSLRPQASATLQSFSVDRVLIDEKGEHHRRWKGYFTAPFLCTEFREGSDVHPFYGVRRVQNPWDPESLRVYIYDCDNMSGVYVDGDSQRGYAAYINLPAYWLNHDEVEILIRRLLELFGEYPQEE